MDEWASRNREDLMYTVHGEGGDVGQASGPIGRPDSNLQGLIYRGRSECPIGHSYD